MAPTGNNKIGIWIGRVLSVLIVTGAIVSGLVVLYHTNNDPRTDDSEILANFIGIAPQVEGPLLHLNVHDNQFVRKGDLLFEIDDRPYRYALEKAISDQATLEGQVSDERRRIAALVSGVSVAEANIHSTEADVSRWAASVDQARADVTTAQEAVSRARAEWNYANNNLHRVEPLLVKQFVTVDQVDRARTSEISQAQALKQAESQLLQAQAGLEVTLAQEQRSKAMLTQSQAQHEQARNAVTTLEPLINQRGARTSAIETARYNLDNCRVYAPFDARVTRTSASRCSCSLTHAPGGRWATSAKANCSTSRPECGPTFMFCPSRTCVFQASWTALVSASLQTPTLWVPSSKVCRMCRDRSTGCIWRRVIRFGCAWKILLPICFE
jgi:multidrug resistance efflux pump